MIAALLLFLIVPSLSVGWLAYLKAADQVRLEITRSAQAKTEMLSLQIDQMLNMEKDNAAQMASGITSEDIINKSPALQAQMDRMSKNHKELGVLTAGAEDGSWMKSPDAGDQIYDPRERTWYKMALSQSEPIISDAFQSATTGEWVVTAAAKLADGQGVFGANVSLNHLKETVDQIHIGKAGKLYMLDNGGEFLFHYKIESGTQFDQSYINEMYTKDRGTVKYTYEGQPMEAVFYTNPATGWKIVGEMIPSEAEESVRPIMIRAITLVSVAVLGHSSNSKQEWLPNKKFPLLLSWQREFFVLLVHYSLNCSTSFCNLLARCAGNRQRRRFPAWRPLALPSQRRYSLCHRH